MKKLVPEKALLLRSCRKVATKAEEKRLVVRAPTKEGRAALIGAIRQAYGHIKAYAALSPWEKSNKRIVYTTAQKLNATVTDHGDRCYLRAKGCLATGKVEFIELSQAPELVRRCAEE